MIAVRRGRRQKREKKSKEPSSVAFSRRILKRDILREAKILEIVPGSAEAIADIVVEKVAKWVGDRAEITEADLDRVVAKKMEPYNKDLAYVFKNRGKII